MQDKIKELYQKLYNENIELLNEKKLEAKEEKNSNTVSITNSIVSHSLLKIAIEIISFILLFLMIKFMISDMTSDYRPGKSSLSFMFYVLIPLSIIITVISFIYKVVIRPRKTIQENYWIQHSTINKEEYNDIFCERICKPIIEYLIPDSKYEHSQGISKDFYEGMGFSNSHETYSSTDNIVLYNNANLSMSKVHTKFKNDGADGYWYTTLFCGLASIQTLTFNMMLSIKIRNKKLDSLKLKNTIRLSNEEFNKYYEVETDHPELLNKYLTDKMLTYFIELAQNNINLEINIFDNKICTRLHDKNFLEFNINNKDNEENIINSCNSIKAIINTNNFIVNELKSNNIF